MVLVQVDEETHALIKEAKIALSFETNDHKQTQSAAIKKWLAFGKSENWKIPRVVL